jgi:RNA polymerase sigma-70 factor (ECF subfamily)
VELVTAFRAALGAPTGDGGLERAVIAAAARARAAWPEFAVVDARFGRRLGELVAGDADPASALDRLRVEDVYLAIACADGIAPALAALEREHVPAVRTALRRMRLTPAQIDDVLQVTRDELLVARLAQPPRILQYAGRGTLRGWLRAVAFRAGLRVNAHPSRQEELDERAHAAVTGDAELELMRRRYGDSFRRAFHDAIAALPAEDRRLLVQRFRHQVSVEDLGILYNVHASTISRRVAAARERLATATRTAMLQELRVAETELASILRLIQSEVAVSLSVLEEPVA